MRRYYAFLLALGVFLVDQLTKRWAVAALGQGHNIVLVPRYVALALTTNTGAAFGMFQSSTIVLGLIALAAVIGIVLYVVKSRRIFPLYQMIALGLALGGASGNFVDRFRLHHVIDFIFVHLGTYPWPVFNIADSAICVGVVILALEYALGAGKPHGQPTTEESHSGLHGSTVTGEPSTGRIE